MRTLAALSKMIPVLQFGPQTFIIQRRKRLKEDRTLLMTASLAVVFKLLHTGDIGHSIQGATGH
jgi:hypothetical protein